MKVRKCQLLRIMEILIRDRRLKDKRCMTRIRLGLAWALLSLTGGREGTYATDAAKQCFNLVGLCGPLDVSQCCLWI